MKRNLIFMVIVIILAPPLVSAERAQAQETIVTDRPGLGSGAAVLSRGTLQWEGGFEYSHLRGADLYSLGQAVLRIGFSSLEIQAAFNSLVFNRDSTGNEEGFRDVGLAIKARFLEDWHGHLSLSALGSLTLPTGAKFLTADEAVPGIALLADYSTREHFSLSNNVGYTSGPGGVEETFFLILTPGFSIPRDPRFGMYFGYAGFYTSSEDQNYLETGFTFGANADLQFDLNGGVELDSGDTFLGAGIARRWNAP